MSVYRIKLITEKGIVIPTRPIFVNTLGEIKLESTDIKITYYEIPKLVLDGTVPSSDPNDIPPRESWDY